ncbi:hypothetical protein [Vibrio nigripulchritudo]|uniref:hypothetical protein n=1 Tax=Vibrio nigripulchritudo TaxID=28173 RepID=UPI00249192CE|nr:hypothetical protein [Vibrio nigripulchritudo]BDU46902.1 hypothetical protein TUMSATVNIG3_57000 [Vibrio nigripulchritudo]
MIDVTLQPNESKRFRVSSEKWLILRDAQKYLYISADNGERIRIDAGDTLDISEFVELEVVNPHPTPIHCVYQMTRRKLEATPPVDMRIGASIAINEVRAVVPTQEQNAQHFTTPDHITIAPRAAQKLFDASATRKEAIIQNISPLEAEAMLGGANVSATAGLPILGDRKAVGGLTITGGGELYAFNNSEVPLVLAILEVHQ